MSVEPTTLTASERIMLEHVSRYHDIRPVGAADGIAYAQIVGRGIIAEESDGLRCTICNPDSETLRVTEAEILSAVRMARSLGHSCGMVDAYGGTAPILPLLKLAATQFPSIVESWEWKGAMARAMAVRS
jgi:hypothetical protein